MPTPAESRGSHDVSLTSRSTTATRRAAMSSRRMPCVKSNRADPDMTWRLARGSGTRCSESYVVSNFFSNFWRIFGKLWEARSLLYRSQSLQPNTHFAAFFEIYKIFILLHHSEFKNSAKFRQTFSQFCSFIFENSLIFRNFCPKFTNFYEKFPEFPANCTDKIKIC